MELAQTTLDRLEDIKIQAVFGSGSFVRSQIAPPAAPAPVAPASAPVPDPQMAEEQQQAEQESRQQAVRASIQEMRQVIVGLAIEIWSMQLTEEQVSELADKMIYQIADAINEITIERVKEIANDLLLGVDDTRRPSDRKRRK